MTDHEFYHHGIKGMKWGVRKYQNKDGSLTPAGKKRYSQLYLKYVEKAAADEERAKFGLQINAYNKTVDEYNRHKIAEYNKKHAPSDKDYHTEYEKQFNRDFELMYKKMYLDFTKNNKNYKKAKRIADKYNLYSYDDLAKRNKKTIDKIESIINGKR